MTHTNNKKGGRPPLDDWCRRTHTVKTTLSELEYANFKRDIQKSGLRPSELLRRLIIHTDLKEALGSEERKHLRDFYKLGVLMKVFFKNTPSHYQEAYQKEHEKLMDAIRKLTDHINSKL